MIVFEIFSSINLSWGHVRSNTKCGPDQFVRFYVYWTQTNRQTPRQAKYKDFDVCILHKQTITIYSNRWGPYKYCSTFKSEPFTSPSLAPRLLFQNSKTNFSCFSCWSALMYSIKVKMVKPIGFKVLLISKSLKLARSASKPNIL